MTLTQEALLKKYADKKKELEELQAEIDELGTKVLTWLDKEGFYTFSEPWGTYSIVTRKKWTYTPELVEKEKEYKEVIKAKQTEEQESGEAKVEEVKGLSFRAKENNGK